MHIVSSTHIYSFIHLYEMDLKMLLAWESQIFDRARVSHIIFDLWCYCKCMFMLIFCCVHVIVRYCRSFSIFFSSFYCLFVVWYSFPIFFPIFIHVCVCVYLCSVLNWLEMKMVNIIEIYWTCHCLSHRHYQYIAAHILLVSIQMFYP